MKNGIITGMITVAHNPNFITPIIKVVENCNFTCEYCRYANHPPKDDSIMSVELCQKIIREVCTYNLSKGISNTSLIFHGGEPLLWGKDRFREIWLYEQELKNEFPDLQIKNGIQTNAFLINDEWIELFSQFKMNVGVSIDGFADLNAHFGKAGKEVSTQTVLDNIHLLQKYNIKCGILSVITEKHFPYAREYFDFLKKEMIDNAGFCYCYNPLDDYSLDTEALGIFMCECFDIYYNSTHKVHIREFENILKKMYGVHKNSCVCKERTDCGNFMAFTPNGTVCFCDAYEKDSRVIGNIKDGNIISIIEASAYQNTRAEYIATVDTACKECKWRCVCGCGCARSDIYVENGMRKNYFCETSKMLCQHILEVIKKDSRLTEQNKHLIEPLRML